MSEQQEGGADILHLYLLYSHQAVRLAVLKSEAQEKKRKQDRQQLGRWHLQVKFAEENAYLGYWHCPRWAGGS